jgi:hypothetical protein
MHMGSTNYVLPKIGWLLFLCLTALSAQEPIQLQDSTSVRKQCQEDVGKALIEGDFKSLDALSQSLCKGRSRLADGSPMLLIFFHELSELPVNKSETAWKEHLTILQRWVDSQPNSLTAKLALSNAYRRKFYGRSSSSDDLQKSLELLVAAEKMPEKSPELYRQLLYLGGLLNWDRAKIEALFKKGVSIDPTYYGLYFAKASFLHDRGAPGEWIKFAEEAVEATKKDEGYTLYARIVWNISGDSYYWSASEEFFRNHKISWEKLKQGFQDLELRHPNALRNINAYCRFACSAGDQKLAKELFDKIGSRWDPGIWRAIGTFQHWKQWADGIKSSHAYKDLILSGYDEVRDMRFSPDGQKLFVGYWDGSVAIWNVSTCKLDQLLSLNEGPIKAICFSPDGRKFAIGTGDDSNPEHVGVVKLFDAASRKEIFENRDRKGDVLSLAFSHDGKMLAIAGGKRDHFGESQIWDFSSQKLISIDIKTPFAIASLVFSRDDKFLIAANFKNLHIWDLTRQKLLTDPSKKTHHKQIRSIVLSPDGKILATGGGPRYDNQSLPGQITFWDTSSWSQLPLEIKVPISGVNSCAFSPDGKYLVTGGYDSAVHLWNVSKGTEEKNLLGHAKTIFAVAYSPDGKRIASGDSDGVKLWDLTPTQEVTQ